MFGAFVLVLVSITALKVIPAYMQDDQINSILVTIANDPEMQKAGVGQIKMSFSKRASIDDIKAITAEDIEITKDNAGRISLAANYDVRVPLFANISLVIAFSPSSAQ
jgi:hypothetical protein